MKFRISLLAKNASRNDISKLPWDNTWELIEKKQSFFFFSSLFFHLSIFILLTLGFDFFQPNFVFENSPYKDAISVIVIPPKTKPPIKNKDVSPKPVLKNNPIAKNIPSISYVNVDKQEKKIIKAKEKIVNLHSSQKQKLTPKPTDLLKDIQKTKAENKKIIIKKELNKTSKSEDLEKTFQQTLFEQEVKLKNQLLQQRQGEINKYKALILQSIGEHWVVPNLINQKLTCELMIRLAPTGMVLDVQIAKTSGNIALDNSARSAVLQASPLPVPKESELFKTFRQFILKVKPENILNQTMLSR